MAADDQLPYGALLPSLPAGVGAARKISQWTRPSRPHWRLRGGSPECKSDGRCTKGTFL